MNLNYPSLVSWLDKLPEEDIQHTIYKYLIYHEIHDEERSQEKLQYILKSKERLLDSKITFTSLLELVRTINNQEDLAYFNNILTILEKKTYNKLLKRNKLTPESFFISDRDSFHVNCLTLYLTDNYIISTDILLGIIVFGMQNFWVRESFYLLSSVKNIPLFFVEDLKDFILFQQKIDGSIFVVDPFNNSLAASDLSIYALENTYYNLKLFNICQNRREF